jgi:glycosyltransferase involved in cell wall biosynthesis
MRAKLSTIKTAPSNTGLVRFDGHTPSVSVLMAVYKEDDPKHFAEALDSLDPFQHRLADVTLVADGPLPFGLDEVIEQRGCTLALNLVRLERSLGLGGALNAGLHACQSEFVLRMDSDDLSRPHRLPVLLAKLEAEPSLDVIGSYIAEFEQDPHVPRALRFVPLEHAVIERRMRMRCVMNHVSCLLRRRAVIDAGGYIGGAGFAEDWWLWARMLKAGCRFANVGEVLADVRVGNGFLSRRRGWAMLKQDLRMIRMMRSIRFMGRHHAAAVFAIKLFQRSGPAWLLERTYAHLRQAPIQASTIAPGR